MLRLEFSALQDRYVATIDNDRLEDWPKLFTRDCLYQIISKENEDDNLPAPVMHCENTAMLRDRVAALRNANIYAKPAYRHFLGQFARRTTAPSSQHKSRVLKKATSPMSPPTTAMLACIM